MKIFIILLIVSLSSTVFAEWFSGENLLQPLPIPGENWETKKSRTKDYFQHTWYRDDQKDVLQTNIYYNTPYRDVFKERDMDSDIGNKNCKHFDIEDESGKPENGYPALSWLSKCQLKDTKTITVLHKVISGNSSFYHLKKIWLKENSEEDINLWKTYLSSVSICDTGYPKEHACPKQD